MKNLRTKYNTELKNRVINGIMKNGEKQIGEIHLTKCFKKMQKKSKKNTLSLLRFSIIETSPAVKINLQTMKRGKRKTKKETPSFIKNEFLRIFSAIKFIIKTSLKKQNSRNFSSELAQEIIDSSTAKSFSVDIKNDVQKQVLLKKRYINKFRW